MLHLRVDSLSLIISCAKTAHDRHSSFANRASTLALLHSLYHYPPWWAILETSRYNKESFPGSVFRKNICLKRSIHVCLMHVSSLFYCFKCLFQIIKNIINILCSDGKADSIRFDSLICLFLLIQFCVGCRCRMNDK